MKLDNFTLDVDADGIGLLTWDMKDRSMNVITEGVMKDLEAAIDHVIATEAIKGCVVTSGKSDFSAGADLTMLEEAQRRYNELVSTLGEEKAIEAAFEQVRTLSLLYRKLETSGKPWAAAINGTAMGGGFELALACHYRVMANDNKTSVGLPEIKVGLFPGAGGVTRVLRLMQTPDGLQFLFKGDQVKANQAKGMNLVHEVSAPADIIAKAKDWIRNGGSPVAPWDVKGWKAPSGKVFSPAGMMIWPPANAIYRRESHDNYPAAKAILQVGFEGLQLPMDLALKVESRWFVNVLQTKVAASMIRTLFLSMGELNKGARRPANEPATSIKKVGIIGAGFMGAGVAYVTVLAGIDVVLIDRDQEAADRGKSYTHKIVSGQIAKGRAKSADREALLAKIEATTDYGRLVDCDLVIEAVFEDRDVKAETTRKAEAQMRPEVIFASNTSTLPITSLAEQSVRRDQFIGIHFFSPVDKMLLVEIIMGKETGDRALATAIDYVRAIKKTPIVVNDTRGFYANRCVLSYVAEAHLMFMEGVPPALIENAAKMAGMPVAPFALNDEVGLDLGWKILQAAKKDLGEHMVSKEQEALLKALVVDRERFGRKNGKGFYDYPESGPKRLWKGLEELRPKKQNPDNIDLQELQHRLLVIQALEAAKTVEEGVVTDPREADVGSIIGFGFAPYTGGTLSYIDGMGAAAFVTLCETLKKTNGERFTPTPLLKDMAAKGETFYGRFGVKTAGKSA